MNGADHLETYLSGDLAQYATLDDSNQNGGPRSVTFTLTLPDALPPGRHLLYLIVRESRPGGMIGGRAAAGGGIVILSLYPTPYLAVELSTANTAVGKPTTATLSLTSWSKVVTPDAWAELVVKDQTGAERLRTTSQHVTIPPQESKELKIPLATGKLEPGRYVVEATIHGAQENLTVKTSFLVGTLDLSLEDHTALLSADKVNRFSFRVGNKWNQQLHNVYGEVALWHLKEKTPTTTVEGFHSATFKTYLDLSGFNVMENTSLQGNITLFYTTPEGKDGSKTFPFTVTVVPEQVPEQVPAVATEEAPHGFFIPLNGLTLLYLALLLLVILNILLLFRSRGGRRGSGAEEDDERKGGESVDIEPPRVS